MIIRVLRDVIMLTILWTFVILVIILPFLPFFILMMAAKLVEEFFYEKLYNAKSFNSEEVPWLHDDSKNRTIINTILLMDDKVSVQKLQDCLSEKLVHAHDSTGKRLYPRSTQYIHFGNIQNYWIEENDFQIEKHVYEWSENSLSNEEEVKHVISKLCMKPLIEANRSPWEYIIIHYKDGGNVKSGILLRSHHSFADGMSYIYFLINQLNDKKMPEIKEKKLTSMQRFLLMTKSFLYIPLMYVKLLLIPMNDNSLKCTEVSGQKHLTWSKPIKLKLIKDIKSKLNVTINDVIVGCLATNIYKYFADNNLAVPSNFTACIPADARLSIHEAKEFSNKIALIFFQLPTTSRDPLKAVLEVNKRMNDVKASAQVYTIQMGLRIFSYFLPEFLNKQIFKLVLVKSSMVLSNVAGPQDPVYVAGRRLKNLVFWPPQKNNVGTSVSIFSYDGHISIGAGVDISIMKDSNELIKRFDETLYSLAKMVGIEDLHESD